MNSGGMLSSRTLYTRWRCPGERELYIWMMTFGYPKGYTWGHSVRTENDKVERGSLFILHNKNDGVFND